MRVPSLKSSLYMALLAGGMVLTGALIWRGAGAPQEPARVVVGNAGKVAAKINLPQAGSYIIFTEQVVAPQPLPVTALRAPEMDLELTDPEGRPVVVEKPGLGAWFYKVITKQRGHTHGWFAVEKTGDFDVRAEIRTIAGKKPDRAVVLAFARTSSLGRLLWLLLGFAGQVCFSLRFIIQWLASEKAGRSTVPRAFWYYSLFGGLMILAYAIYTRDPVFIMAYAFNAFIYVRNLVLIRREDKAAVATAPAGAGDGAAVTEERAAEEAGTGSGDAAGPAGDGAAGSEPEDRS
jgi:lipid-A-disaccharide synthase-like uncharacterized protein